MSETEHHYVRRHRHRRRTGSSKSKYRWKAVDYLLLLWSLASLGAFYYLVEKTDNAPLWQIGGLAASTLVGLVLFFRYGFRIKK